MMVFAKPRSLERSAVGVEKEGAVWPGRGAFPYPKLGSWALESGKEMPLPTR